MNLPEFLIEILQNQYGEETLNKIINGYEKDRMLTFRANTLKTTSKKIKRINN